MADIQELIGPGISADTVQLGKFMAETLVRTQIRVCRPRLMCPLDTPEDRAAATAGFQDYLIGERIRFIPPEVEREYSRIERNARNLVGYIMPRTRYLTVKEEFIRRRDEYLQVRDRFLASYDRRMAEFRLGLETYLDRCYGMEQARQIFQTICARIPTREEYRSRVSMTLSVSQFETEPVGDPSELGQDLQASWCDSVVTTAKQMIEASIRECWDLFGTATRALKQKGTVSGRTTTSMKNLAAQLKWKNVFENPLLEETRDLLEEFVETDNPRLRSLIVEQGISEIWAYARTHGIELDASATAFSGLELDQMKH